MGFSSWVLAVVNDAVDPGGRDGAFAGTVGSTSTSPKDSSTTLSSLLAGCVSCSVSMAEFDV